jgi:hypothetical protein
MGISLCHSKVWCITRNEKPEGLHVHYPRCAICLFYAGISTSSALANYCTYPVTESVELLPNIRYYASRRDGYISNSPILFEEKSAMNTLYQYAEPGPSSQRYAAASPGQLCGFTLKPCDLENHVARWLPSIVKSITL